MPQTSKKIILLTATCAILVLLNLILISSIISKNSFIKAKDAAPGQTNTAAINVIPAALNSEQPANNLKTLDPAIILQSESIIKSLLGAKDVIIRSPQEIADIDNDGQEELLVFAMVVDGPRPTMATGSWQDFAKEKTTYDLIILGQNPDTSFQFKYYYIQAFTETTSPLIWLQDFNRDKKVEIILTTGSKELQANGDRAKIYQIKENKLDLVTFISGFHSGAEEIFGALEIVDSKGIYLNIYIDEEKKTPATYEMNEQGYFEFINTTANPPTVTEQKVIDYLSQNITKLVKAQPILGASSLGIFDIQFYPDNKFLVYFEDGHFIGYFLGQYSLTDNLVATKYINETTDYGNFNQFRAKNGLKPTEAKNYSRSLNGYQLVETDVFKH